MKKDKYLYFSTNIYLHFFGKSSIIIDDLGMEYLYDETQTDIFELCNGTNTCNDVVNKLAKIYSADKNNYELLKTSVCSFLKVQIKKNILKISNKIVVAHNIYGKIGKYYPSALSIEITSKCNFLCPHCYKLASSAGNDIKSSIIEYVNEKI